MNIFKDIFSNYYFITPIIAWFVAQLLKMIITFIKDKKFNPRLALFSSGGMPSSHSATVSSLCAACAIFNGFASFEFAISFVLAVVVMTDAVGVRREAGEQAKVINKIMEELFSGNPEKAETALKELIGHTPFQVLMGVVVGISTSFVVALIMKII